MSLLYDKVSGRKEAYNYIDKVLLGLCFLIIPLSLWSLWLPSNHYFLVIPFIGSIIYWIINRAKIQQLFIELKKGIDYSRSQIVLFLLYILASLFFFSWQQEVYDSAFYHFQNIRWNEEYAVVPGLANLDDRFGFNSNYFLLSAIFSFRFILGEAIYTLQSLIVVIIGLWVINELFRSSEIKRMIIFISYVLLFGVSIYFLGNTSTDIIPNFIVFYIFARIILYPDLLRKNCLIGIVLPVFLLTCKLSFTPIGIISIFILYHLIKGREYKPIIYTCIIGLLIIIPWLIRNVIISGYLIYPLYQLDFFSFDWKVPIEVAMKERDYIFEIGYYFFRIAVRYPHMSVRDPLFINILTDAIYLLTFSSFILFIYLFMKKRKEIPQYIFLSYIVSFILIIVWVTGGPDLRFVAGVLCSVVSIGGILFFKDRGILLSLSKSLILIFTLSIIAWTGSRYCSLITQINGNNQVPLSNILIKPCTVKDQLKAKGIDITQGYKKYPINNGLYIWTGPGLPFDMTLPASIDSHYAKFIPLDQIEARGKDIQDGFKMKEKSLTNYDLNTKSINVPVLAGYTFPYPKFQPFTNAGFIYSF
jgi:hypothetical protein